MIADDYVALPPENGRAVASQRGYNTFVYAVKTTLASNSFQWLIIVMIAANAALMGLETFDFVSTNHDWSVTLEILDYGFLVFFTGEIALQFIAHGYHFFDDGWLIFDLSVIVGSWLFQPFRVLRSLRILRVIRLVSRMDTLKKLVQALFASLPKLFNIFILFLLIFYMYGVMFTSMFKDLYRKGFTDQDYFSNLGRTFYTLFQLLTMDCWSCISSQVMAVYQWAWIPIVSFILLSAFIVVNLVIAVICDAISEYQRKDIEEQLQAMSQQSLSSHSANDGAYTALQLKLEDTTRKVDELTALLHTLLQNPSRVTAMDPTPPMERFTATGERF